MAISINDFLSNGKATTTEGASAVGKAASATWNGTKKTASTLASLAPAPVRMVKRVEEESMDRDIELDGNIKILFGLVNEVRQLAGLSVEGPLTPEEATDHIEATRKYLAELEAAEKLTEKQKKREEKEAKKASKPKNKKLAKFMDGVDKEDPSPVEETEAVDVPYEDGEEEEGPVPPTRQLNVSALQFNKPSESKYDYNQLTDAADNE